MSSPPNVVINIGGQQPVSGHRPKHGALPFPPPCEGPEGYYGPPRKKEEHRSFFANMLIGASVVTTAATIVGAGLIYHFSPRAAASMLQKLEKKSKLPSFLKDIKKEDFTGLGESAKKQKPFVLKSMAFGYKIAGKFTAAVARHLPETSSIKENLGHLSGQFKSLATESKTAAQERKLEIAETARKKRNGIQDDVLSGKTATEPKTEYRDDISGESHHLIDTTEAINKKPLVDLGHESEPSLLDTPISKEEMGSTSKTRSQGTDTDDLFDDIDSTMATPATSTNSSRRNSLLT